MGKLMHRRLQVRRNRANGVPVAKVQLQVHRAGEATWVVAVEFVDGQVQLTAFDSEPEARRMVAVVAPELEGVDPGVKSVSLQDVVTGQVVQRWEGVANAGH